MREIKFRGYDEENKCWRYGWYTRLQEGARKFDAIICEEDGTLVRYYIHDRKTIGQYTGLKDKNGKEIYEGDIVSGKSWKEPYTRKNYKIAIGLIEYTTEYGFVFSTRGLDGKYRGLPKGCRTYPSLTKCEIIGNIHENPELLS